MLYLYIRLTDVIIICIDRQSWQSKIHQAHFINQQQDWILMNNECAKLMHCITLALALEACKTFQPRKGG